MKSRNTLAKFLSKLPTTTRSTYGKSYFAGLAFLFTVLALPLLAPLAEAETQNPRASAAIAIAAQRLHVPENELRMVNEVQLGKYASLKVSHMPTGRVEIVFLNPNNKPVPLARVEQVLGTRSRAAFKGKQERALADRVAQCPAGELTSILVWAKPVEPTPRFARPGAFPLAQSVSAEALKEFHKNATRKLVEDAKREGWTVLYQSQYAPVVLLQVPNGRVKSLEERPDVEALYLSRRYSPELDISARAIDADKVWARGFTGANGVKIAVVEGPDSETNTGDAIYFGHSYLADGTYCNSSATPFIGLHPTEVAGVIASTSATYRGIAYGAPPLLDGNAKDWGDAELMKCTEWAINQGAVVINYSWGFDTGSQLAGLDQYADYLVRSRSVTIVKSAGNSSTAPQSPVTSPGKGFNVLTVGNYDDRNTVTNSDDVMSSTSRYGNPASLNSDRQKPEVSAPGVAINTTCINSPTCIAPDRGTSFSAPHVSGCAALLMNRNSVLSVWPESIRAVLMASAVTNIEGNRTLSEIDGTGGIECDSADDVVSGAAGGEQHDVLVSTGLPRDFSFNIYSGEIGHTVRAVIAWDSNPNQYVTGATVYDPLQADLDLEVIGPDGTVVARSNSYDNSYEIAEFTIATAGLYTVRITAARFEGSSEYVGFAWWTGVRERN